MTDLHCKVGDLVEFDCPHNPESHGRSARVVGPAGINGPDWWELELRDEFFVIPDIDNPGCYVKTSQSFAPDHILKPYEVTQIDRARLPRRLPIGDLFYVVGSHGIIYGPPMLMDAAKRKAAGLKRAEIVPAWLLAEQVGSARELSGSTQEALSEARYSRTDADQESYVGVEP
ncbi:hypothetical protein [Paraburkholderia sp. ZP32-5]|uniref:hypothetical protein n=1 Tax=Paraburkholderia sp. ZP32-5 TaxID=2883245 RepID=UPI001F17CB45|nr:hypothetical protein [Paraburkholderia sp. ZP32-5]